jgi:hypothetical protein
MGFYLRKSLRAGPFRFNLSPSGLGVSAGVPGFRVGTGPRGNYVHVGAAGVHYRATLGAKPRARQPQGQPTARPTVPAAWLPAASSDIVMEDTTGATASQMLPTDADDFVTQLNDAARRLALWPWALTAAVVLAVLAPPIAGIVVAIAGLAGVVWLYLRDRARRSVVAFYDVNGLQADWFQTAVDALTAMGQSSGLWRLNAAGQVQTTHQYKVNAGASTIISRANATVGMSGPKVLVTNIAVPSITAGGHALHFLPDRLLVRDGRQFASVSYAALRASESPSRFIEDGRVPRDAQQVDTTWKFVNVKGGPDRRYNNNRQLPVMLYGKLSLTTAAGLQWILDCSRVGAAQQVAGVLARAQAPQAIAAPVV